MECFDYNFTTTYPTQGPSLTKWHILSPVRGRMNGGMEKNQPCS
jgi:hypothetical protein